MGNMGKAGRVLKEVLTTYGISQNKLAIAMGVRSSVVYRWFNERIDPTGDIAVAKAVRTNSGRGEAFARKSHVRINKHHANASPVRPCPNPSGGCYTLVKMVEALKEIDRDAAQEFVRQYLGEIVEDDSD